MVREEFQHLMAIAIGKAVKAGLPLEQQYWSWDNAHANMTTAEAQALAGRKHIRLPLPPWSPDMHKVIEHVMHTLKTGFSEALDLTEELPTPKQMQHMVRGIFYDIPAAHIQADVDTLPLTYLSIAAPQGKKITVFEGDEQQGEKLLGRVVGVEGDWAPKALR